MNELDALISNQASLEKLESYLHDSEIQLTREYLLSQFQAVSFYKNLSEWNKAVKICECLAIIGWGESEPLEATSYIFLNGSYITNFIDKFAMPQHLFAMWSKRKDSFGIDPKRSSVFHGQNSRRLTEEYPHFTSTFETGIFLTQANHIPQNPVKVWVLIENCFPELEPVKIAVKHIRKHLDGELWRTPYGEHWIPIDFLFESEHSTRDHALEIPGSAYAFEGGFINFKKYSKKFKSSPVQIFLQREFANNAFHHQLDGIIDLILISLAQVKSRLSKYRLHFDFDLLIDDTRKSLATWKQIYSN